MINRDWTFNYFPDPGAGTGHEAPAADDSAWSAVAVPHTWSTYEMTRKLHPYIHSPSERDDPYWWQGWGWYRKHFSLAREAKATAGNPSGARPAARPRRRRAPPGRR